MRTSKKNIGCIYKELQALMSDADARYVLKKRAGLSWSDIMARPEDAISKDQARLIASDIAAYKSGAPLSRIYGVQEFYGYDFFLNEGALDPRQDSELLVNIALDRFGDKKDISMLDLGTGSGCLILSLLKNISKSRAIAVDKSAKALEIAQKNATMLGVSDRISIIESDWWDNVPQMERFDLIISNPPYIRSAVIPELSEIVQKYDPIQALDGGDDGLQAYNIIFPQLSSRLNHGGIALFEIGYDQEDDLVRLSEKHGFTVKDVHRDLAGQPRVVEICCGDK